VCAVNYRLPGVYSHESNDLRVNIITGGNARVAFLGPAIGYKTIVERGTFRDAEPLVLSNKGLVGQVVCTSENSGITFSQTTDFDVLTAGEGFIALSRKITVISNAVNNDTIDIPIVKGMSTYSFNIVNGYLLKGSISITGADEGTDYVVNYLNGTITFIGSLLEEDSVTVAYGWTEAEPVQLVGEATTALRHKYVSRKGLGTKTLEIAFADGSTPGAAGGYEENVDYLIDYQTGRISRTSTSRIPSYDYEEENYMYVSYGYCAIRSNETVRVVYGFADDSYSDAQWFSNINDIFSTYGQPWGSNGKIQSVLSAGAYIASKNGMSQCYCVAVQGDTINAWDAAFQALSMVDGIDIVVPLSADPAVRALCRDHLAQMRENQDERVAIFGLDGTIQQFSAQQMITTAQGLDSPDLWLIGPSTFKFRNPITNVVEIMPGYYAAAGVAGYNSSVMQATPLTQKVISGLFSANEYNTKATKQLLSSNGVMYVDEVNGQMRIVHGRTTSNSSIADMETATVLSKHYIIKTMRRAFANGYIGSQLTPDTPIMVKSAAHSVLLRLQGANYISSFSGLSVEQDPIVPTQLNVNFSYLPMYPLETIDITFSVSGGSFVR